SRNNISSLLLFKETHNHKNLHSFPTRRSSDLYEDEKVIIVTLKIQNKGEYAIDEDLIAGTNTHPVLLLTNTDYRRVSRSDRKIRSEEHTSELQSRFDLVCRLLLEKKNNKNSKY